MASVPLLSARSQTVNTCIDCHSVLEPPLQVTADQFSHDIHAQKGLTCASCHGGDPAKADMGAMSKAAGFRGKIEKAQIPALCARCHADAAFMRQYNPSLRTDQFSQYQTSVHGKLLAKGNSKVAVCTDCHGVHDLRAPADAASKVHPLNIASTCAHCHASAEYMKEFKIPTDQFAKYSGSVHHEAMVVRGDLSAPTCTTCHGNHGAAPPGLSTVQNVCSTCHVFQAQLYEKSPHKKAFDAAALPGCVVCHSNHGIAHPTDAKIGNEAQSVCMDCHVAGDAGAQAAAQIHTELTNLSAAINDADQLLTVAESSGMEVSDARLQQDQARDALTKARVSIHSFQPATVNEEVQTGLKISARNLQAGKDALAERDYRRRGLMVALIFIFITVAALYFYIRQIEREPAKT
jgi:hypothetical protein